MSENQLDKEIGNRVSEVIDKVSESNSRRFAQTISIDPSQLTKIQKGTRGLTIEKAVEISTTFGVDINWLLLGKGDIFYKEGNPAANQLPDQNLLTRLENELKSIRLSLDNIEKVALVIPDPQISKGHHPLPIALGKKRGHKSHSKKNEPKDSVSEKGK